MEQSELISAIAKTLLTDYSSVYYVNATTGEYHWFSEDPKFHSLNLKREGTDFFNYMKNEVVKVVYEEDKHVFSEDLQKDKLLENLKNGDAQNVKFRLMVEGQPVYYRIRVIHQISDDNGDIFIIGVKNIEKQENRSRERERYNIIAKSLAEDYDDIFYIDIETGRYTEFSPSEMYESMNVPTQGDDFYRETRENAERYAHPDDREFAVDLYYKDKMLENLKDRKSFSYKYRIMVLGEPRVFRFKVILSDDKKHFVLCVKDVNDEITAENNRKKHITFGQIAESLATNYDVIYYVDLFDDSYVTYTTNNIYGQLELQSEGPDFFGRSREAIRQIIHPNDKDKVIDIMDKEFLLSVLEERKQFSIDYRLFVDGVIQNTRLVVRKSSNKKNFILCVENIDEEVRKEQERIQVLNNERELARRDELTGVKNKTAYAELEKSVQNNLDNGMNYLPFALVVCDINWLKRINDTEGHNAGDEYIKASANLLSDVFSSSPIFRIGGDEFVVFLRGNDYPERYQLIQKLHMKIRENVRKKSGPVIAVGLAEYDSEKDKKVSDIFNRADIMMYEDKKHLKEQEELSEQE